MLPFIVVTCALWTCAAVPLKELNNVNECVTLAAEADRQLSAVIKDIDVRVVCMSREQYAITAKLSK